MRNFLVGCGVIVLLLVAAIIGAGWWVSNKAMEMKGQIEASRASLQATNKKFPFTSPANGLVAENRLVSWLQVNQKSIPAQEFPNPAKGRQQGIKAIGNFYKTMTTFLPAIGQQQARSLQAAAMSFNEYQWIGARVIDALNSGDALADPVTARMAKALEAMNQTSPGRNPYARAIRSFGTPPTSQQIAQILSLLKKHEQEFMRGSQGLAANYTFMSMYQQRNRPMALPSATAIPTAAPAVPVRVK